MKKIILTFIILNLFLSLKIYCQPYKSIFGNQSTQWNVFYDNLSSWTCFVNTINDTIINSKAFKKIGYSGVNCVFTGNDETYLREDTLIGKAWVYDLYNNDERLILNLSLNLGDTFRIYPNSPYYDTIAFVDSVYFENNLKKIRLNVYTSFSNNEKLTFIEGIGTNLGINYAINSYFFEYMGSTHLLCSYKDSLLEYFNTLFDTCSINYVGINRVITPKSKISFFPNPITDKSTLDIPQNISLNKLKIEIFDIQGRKIKQYPNPYKYKLNLNRTDFKTGGLYFLCVKSDTFFEVVKVVVE